MYLNSPSSSSDILSNSNKSTSFLIKVDSEATTPTSIESTPKQVVLDEEANTAVIFRHHEPTGNFFSSSVNLINTILGAGMLSMSYAISTVGIIPGSILILIMGCASTFGLHLLAVAASKVGRESSFFSISKITYPKAGILFDLAIGVKCFGVATSYLIIIGDLMPSVMTALGAEGFFAGKIFWVSMAMFIAVPLTLLRKLDSLKYTSFLSLLAVVYLFVLVSVFFATTERPSLPAQLFAPFDIHKVIGRLPIFIFAFTCHQNIFSIHNEKRVNSVTSINKVVIFSVGLSGTIYLLLGNMGYMTFGKAISENLLNQYENHISVTVGRIAYVFLTAFSYPLQTHPCRSSLEKILPLSTELHIKYATYIYYGLSFAILAASYAVACLVSKLGLVLAIVGATGSVSICYILPALFYCKITADEPYGLKKIMAILLGCFGVVVMCVCLPVTIMGK